MTRSIVSRRAAQLHRAGLLQSSPDPEERRATLLSLTPTGEHAVAVMRERLVAVIDRQLDSWPAADRRSFARLLDRFVRAEMSNTAG